MQSETYYKPQINFSTLMKVLGIPNWLFIMSSEEVRELLPEVQQFLQCCISKMLELRLPNQNLIWETRIKALAITTRIYRVMVTGMSFLARNHNTVQSRQEHYDDKQVTSSVPFLRTFLSKHSCRWSMTPL
jgi:hypothetical protein